MNKKKILIPLVAGGLFTVAGYSESAFAAEETTANTTSTQTTPSTETPSTATTTTEGNTVTDVATTTPTEEKSVNVRILASTDLHTNLVNYDYYQDKDSQNLGLAKTAIKLKEAIKENPNVIIVDNGDTIQGTPLGTYKAIVDPVEKGENHPMYEALEALNYDAVTLGNHEFNYGLEYLDTVLKGTKLPAVNANVKNMDGTLRYTPYIILDKTFKDNLGNDVLIKVGITGIVPPQILNWDKALLEGKIVVEDSIKALEKIVPDMKQAGSDIVLVLSHSGIGDDIYEEGEENIAYHIPKIEGVDAVITGHSHATYPDPKSDYAKLPETDEENGRILGKPVVMAGKYGDHLGLIDLKLVNVNGKWQVDLNNSKGEIRKIDTKSTVADEEVLAIAKESHDKTVEYVRQKVGETTADINSYFALVKDDPSIQIVNNAQLWYAKEELKGTELENLPLLSPAAPFKAGTRGDATAYTDIKAGPIAIKNVADLYLYDNVTAIVKLTGAQIKEWLEMSAGQFNTIDPNVTTPQNIINTNYRTYNFDVIDGLTYEYDITQPNKYDKDGKVVNADASRVRNLKFEGKEIDPNQEFVVVTNNYRMSGQFPGVKDASLKQLLGLENRQVIINYITKEKLINPSADDNWTFSDTLKGLDLRFTTADSAQSLIEKLEDVTYVGTTEPAGFGEYRYTYLPAKVTSNGENLTNELLKAIIVKEKIPFKTIFKEDPTLESGKEIVEVEGVEGSVTKVTINNETTVLESVAQVDRVVRIGTKKLANNNQTQANVTVNNKEEVKEDKSQVVSTARKVLPSTGIATSSSMLGIVALMFSGLLIRRKIK